MQTGRVLARIARATRKEDVLDLVCAHADRSGFSVFAIGAPSRGNFFLGYFVSNWPESWIELYEREGFRDHDPLPMAAALNAMPFLWSDLVAGRAGFSLSPEQLRVTRLAAEHGYSEGLCVPIHGPGGSLALASYGGTMPDTSPETIADLHILALHAHVRLSAIARGPGAAPGRPGPGGLSPREIEALRCAHAGLTDAAMALKMGLSERTARFHIDNARRKLGAKTRTQAILAAVAQGLISI